MGYGTIFPRLRPIDKRSLTWNIVIFFFCLLASKFSILLLLPLFIMVFIISGIFCTNLLINMRRLQLQQAVFREAFAGTVRPRETPPYQKKAILKRFQLILTTYFFFYISLILSEFFVNWSSRNGPQNLYWISLLLYELFEFCLALGIAFTFRLRSFKNMDKFNDSNTDFGANQPTISQIVQDQIGFDSQLQLAKSEDQKRIIIFHHGKNLSKKEFSMAFLEKEL